MLDIKTGYRERKDDFIKARTRNYLGRAYAPGTFAESLSEDVQKKIISRAMSFQGSFRALDIYLALLFQNFGLTTTDARVSDIESSPDTETALQARDQGIATKRSYNSSLGFISAVMDDIVSSASSYRRTRCGRRHQFY